METEEEKEINDGRIKLAFYGLSREQIDNFVVMRSQYKRGTLSSAPKE